MRTGKKFVVSEDLANQIRKEYERGDSTPTLARRYGLTKATVARNIRRVGGELRVRTVMPPPPQQQGLLAWLND